MTSKPLFIYSGAKDKEMKEIKNFLPPLENINMIMEPFGGSFALTRHLHNEFPDKEYYVNDIDPTIISIYQHMCDPKRCQQVITDIKSFLPEIDKTKYNLIKKTKTVAAELFQRVFFNIAPGLFPQKTVNINFEVMESFPQYGNVKFLHGNGIDMCEKFKDNPSVFLFLDPPYVCTDNKWYSNSTSDVNKLFEFLKTLNTCDAKILLVIDDNVLVRTFIDSCKLKIVGKTTVRYGRSKKMATHLYVSNYI